MAEFTDPHQEEVIKVARKYGLRPGTVKCEVFRYFEAGYKPSEIRFLLSYVVVDMADERRFSRNVSRYHFDWKKAQH